MNDINIITPNEYSGTFHSYYNIEANKVLDAGGMEALIFHMQKGISGCFQSIPGESNVEMYYVKKGVITLSPLQEASRTISEGSFFAFNNRDDGTIFSVIEDTELLCFSNTTYYEQCCSLNVTLDDCLKKIEQKDGYTRTHCEHVRLLSMQIASHMPEFDGSNLELLLQAARLHDVGKAKIPTEILIKPSALTAEEYDIMKKHSEYSSDMVGNLFHGELAKVIYYHHERFDGKGYPSGLKGKEIPICSRIIAVADAFDAMVSDRPYRKGMPEQTAINNIISQSGKQFDPVCVEALCQSLADAHEAEKQDIILQRIEGNHNQNGVSYTNLHSISKHNQPSMNNPLSHFPGLSPTVPVENRMKNNNKTSKRRSNISNQQKNDTMDSLAIFNDELINENLPDEKLKSISGGLPPGMQNYNFYVQICTLCEKSKTLDYFVAEIKKKDLNNYFTTDAEIEQFWQIHHKK